MFKIHISFDRAKPETLTYPELREKIRAIRDTYEADALHALHEQQHFTFADHVARRDAITEILHQLDVTGESPGAATAFYATVERLKEICKSLDGAQKAAEKSNNRLSMAYASAQYVAFQAAISPICQATAF